MDYAWGGYKNGQIPSIAMAIIPDTDQFIKKDLLPGVIGLRAAFRTKFGYTLAIVEAYRSLATQQYLYNGWKARKPGFNLAAPPGTSMHGWGLSIDFGSNVNTYGSAEKKWMDANAPRFGFLPTGNSFSPREAWHFDGTGTVTAAVTSKPIVAVQAEEAEDMANGLYPRQESNGSIYFQENPGAPMLPIVGSQWNTAAANGNKSHDLTDQEFQALIRRVGVYQLAPGTGRVLKNTDGSPNVYFG